MGAHTLPDKLDQAVFPASGTGLYVNGIGYVQAWGTSVPSNGTAGYGKSCIFNHTDGSDVTDLVYVNTGTNTSCTFVPISSLE